MRKVLRRKGLGGGAGQRKAEAARSEWEGDGVSDIEVLFTSAEEAKPPTILATGARSEEKSYHLR